MPLGAKFAPEHCQQRDHLEAFNAQDERRGDRRDLLARGGEPRPHRLAQIGGAHHRERAPVAAHGLVALEQRMDRRAEIGRLLTRGTAQPGPRRGFARPVISDEHPGERLQRRRRAADAVEKLVHQRLTPGVRAHVGRHVAQREHIARAARDVVILALGDEPHPRRERLAIGGGGAEKIGGSVGVVGLQKPRIGMQDRRRVEIIEHPPVKPRRMGAAQKIGRLTVIKHKLMRRGAEQNAHRHIAEQGFEPVFFLRKPGGLALHGFSERGAGLVQMACDRGGGGGKIAQIAPRLGVEIGLDLGMRARPDPACEPLDGFGHVFVEEKPDRRDQPGDDEARNHAADDEAIERFGLSQFLEAEHKPRYQRDDIAQSQRREKQEDAQAQAETGKAHHAPPASSSRCTSSRNSFNSKGLAMNPSAPSASPLRRSIAEPRAVIIRIFTSERPRSARTSWQIS